MDIEHLTFILQFSLNFYVISHLFHFVWLYSMEIRKVKITRINDIHHGDHITNRMQNGLWHHEIVTLTFPSRDVYEAIGFINNRAGYCCLQEEMRKFTEVKNSSNEEFYPI